jgi:hypothetical protein
MRITASGATDGGNVVLFWPDNLPDDADDSLRNEASNLVDSLCKDGKLIWFLCEGDGDYTLAVYVNEPVPEDLRRICKDEEKYATLRVKGDGYFGGMEYLFKHDSTLVDKSAGMLQKIAIPDGTYSATVYRTEQPDGFYQSWLRNKVGPAAKWLWNLQRAFAMTAFVSILSNVMFLFFPSWGVWFHSLGVTVFLLVGAITLSRTKWYRLVAEAKAEFSRAYPSYVVLLHC